MMLRQNAYGKSLFNTVGPFGGLSFGAVSTPAPPDPNGWTPGTGKLANVQWADAVNPVTGRPGWVRQMGTVLNLWQDKEYVGREFMWILFYATTDGVTQKWYWKWAKSQPYYPAVPTLPEDTVTGGEGPTGATQTTGSGGDPRVTALQQALNLAGAKGKDGKQLVPDGRLGPNTCWACYWYQGDVGLKEEPTLTEKFFAYLGLPASYAGGIGNSCASYYTGPLSGSEKYQSEEPVYTPPATGGQSVYDPPPVVEQPPALVEVSQAGFPWWAGLLAGAALIGGALWMKKRGKKRGRK